MNPEDYCYQKAAPPGSAVYYSIRQLPQQQRDAVVAITAFYLELNDLIFECSDPAVAFAKVNWWQTQMTKLVEGKPDHPVALALQKAITNFNLSPQRFSDLLNGVTQNFNLSPFASFEDITVHLIHTAGVRELLIADVVQKEEKISSETLYQFMLVLELIQSMQHLRHYVRRGLILFAEEELKQFHVNFAELQAYRTTDEIRHLLQYQVEKIERAYQQACAGLTPGLRKTHANLIIRCEIALAVLKEIRASQFAVLENYIELTPLRRWWVAFKA